MKELEDLLTDPVKLTNLEAQALDIYNNNKDISIPKAWMLAALELLEDSGFVLYPRFKVVK